MSNIIPPLLSDSPPPPPPLEDDEEDEFGDFAGTNDFSFTCDNFSLPESPLNSPKKHFDFPITTENLDINRNTEAKKISEDEIVITKDFQDRRKEDNKVILPDKCAKGDNDNFDISDPPSILEKIKGHNLDQPEKNHNSGDNDARKSTEQIENHEHENSDVSTNSEHLTVEAEQNSENDVNTRNNLPNGKVDDSSDDCLTIFSNDIQEDVSENKGELCNSILTETDTNIFQHIEFENGTKIKVTDRSENLKEFNSCSLEISEITQKDKDEFNENNGECINSVPTTNHKKGEIFIDEVIGKKENGIVRTAEKNTKIDTNIAITTEETIPKTQKHDNTNNTQAESDDFDDDDFGDFVSEANITFKSAEADDFTDFTSARTSETTQAIPNAYLSGNDNDFDDFASWEQSPTVQKVDESAPQFDVDFSANNQQSKEYFDINEHNAFEKAVNVLKEIFPAPDEEDDEEDIECPNLNEIIKTDLLYNQIEDFTQAYALKFQYANSQCREILLNALNIDVRNIFPGMPRFAANLGPTPLEPMKSNLSAPSLTPKVKQEQVPPKPARQNIKAIDVPSAQFDWSGSGLQNPLDLPQDSQTMLLDLEQLLVVSLDKPNLKEQPPNTTPSPNTDVDYWDVWLQTMTAKGPQLAPQQQASKVGLRSTLEPISIIPTKHPSVESSKADHEVNKLPLNELSDFTPKKSIQTMSNNKNIIATSKADLEVKNSSVDEDFNDFMSHQPEIQPQGYNVILRETHISSLSQVNRNSEMSLEEIEKDVAEDFDDFQVAPSSSNKSLNPTLDLTIETADKNESVDYDTQKILEKLSELKRKVSNTDSMTQIEIPIEPIRIDSTVVKEAEMGSKNSLTEPLEEIIANSVPEHPSVIPKSLPLTVEEPPKVNNLAKQPSLPDEEDEFTDFHCSEPPKSIAPLQVTILEPLRPLVLIQPKRQNSVSQGQISWPNPGITDDDIRNIELNYSRVQDTPKDDVMTMSKDCAKHHSKEVKTVPSGIKVTSKQSSSRENSKKVLKEPRKPVTNTNQNVGDDEWSDFVSVQKTSPVHKLQEKERSATPDLPLSVLNLSNLQPAKKPIPVITPQGLIQTKLSSTTISPVVQGGSRVMQPKVEHLPINLISNQYASHMTFGNLNGFSDMSVQQGGLVPQNASSSIADDDDWSDFVSHQTSNNIPKRYLVNQNLTRFENWDSRTPNIITNPVSFETDFNRQQVRRQPNSQGAHRVKTYGLPGISIPELEFTAPKNRTSHKK